MKIKKISLILAMILSMSCFVGIFTACNDDSSKGQSSATSIEISKTECQIGIGATQRINTRTKPAAQSVTWTISDDKILKIEQKSNTATTVKGLAEGTATLTATSGTVSASCQITVSSVRITLNETNVTLDITDSIYLQLKATVDGTTTKPTWSSDNDEVATVDKNGLVKGIKQGNANISATIGDAKATCAISVTVPDDYYKLTSAQNGTVIANPGKWYIYYGAGLGTYIDAYYANQTAKMMFNGIGEGKEWFLRYQPNYPVGTVVELEYDLTISVDAKITFGGASAEKFTTELMPAGTYKVKSMAGTDDGENTIIIGKRTVDASTALSIKLSDNAGRSIGGTFSFSVSNLNIHPCFTIRTEKSEIDFTSQELTTQITPYYFTEGSSISYSSLDESVATVNSQGLVTAHKIGETTITATCTDENQNQTTSSILIKVIGPVVLMDKKQGVINLNSNDKTFTLSAYVSNNPEANIQWSTSDDSIATVENGVVTGIQKGKVTITATSEGAEEATAIIYVGTALSDSQESILSEKIGSNVAANAGTWYHYSEKTRTYLLSYQNGTLKAEFGETGLASDDILQFRYRPNGYESGTQFTLSFTISVEKDAIVQIGTSSKDTYSLVGGNSYTLYYQGTLANNACLNIKLKGPTSGTVSISEIFYIF